MGTDDACDLPYLIKPHLRAIMQLLTVELREYNMSLITTKCLNTAVLLMYLYLGADALHATRQCDVPNVVARSESMVSQGPQGGSQSAVSARGRGAVLRALRDEVLAQGQAQAQAQAQSSTGRRALFYVLLTDGPMQRAPEPAPSFPGHVFVIERLPRGTFNVMQSYIGHYDLSGHIDAWGGLSVGRRAMTRILDGLVSIGDAGVWDRECSDAWQALTHTPAEHARQWEGATLGRRTLLPCFKTVQPQGCLTQLREIVDGALDRLAALPDPDAVYGDPSMFPAAGPHEAPRPAPLTVAQMQRDLLVLRAKM